MSLHRRASRRCCRCSPHAGSPRAPAAKAPRRMVCINTPLGLHPAAFFPEKAGKDYALSPYLEVLKDFRDDFTVISGLSHPDVGPSHDSNYSFLTGAPHPEQRAGFRNTISLDQFAAEHPPRRDALRQPAAVVRGLRPVVDPQRRAGAGGVLAVERVRQAVPRRPARRGRGPGAPPAGRPEHPRRGPRAGEETAVRGWAPATATSSTSTSPASANWSSDWPSPRSGRRSPSRRWMPSRRRTSRTRPT